MLHFLEYEIVLLMKNQNILSWLEAALPAALHDTTGNKEEGVSGKTMLCHIVVNLLETKKYQRTWNCNHPNSRLSETNDYFFRINR